MEHKQCQHHASKQKNVGASTDIFTCPMHPEIRQIGPGDCPECGMALEPLIATSDDLSEYNDALKRFIVSAVFTFPVFVLAMGGMLVDIATYLPEFVNKQILELVFSLPVCLWAAWPFYQRAFVSIKNKKLNMFTLVGVGVLVAFFYSVVAAMLPELLPNDFKLESGHVAVYFEAAAMIVTLIWLGQVLELKARASTSDAIKKLMGLAAKSARKIDNDGAEVDIPLENVVVGDKLKVRPGEKIPVDGILLEGSAVIDESMITGEPIPVLKKENEKIIGATLNTNTAFVMQASKVGSDTLLSRIVLMVAEAQRTKAEVQKLADTIASYFVPAVVLISLLTFFAWSIWGPAPQMGYALVNAIAVLIIACPCALGLATPISIMVAMGRGASSGILFKNSQAIEMIKKIDVLVVDKTGTLTEGKPKLIQVYACNNYQNDKIISYAASLERNSEHPLGIAIVRAADEQHLPQIRVNNFISLTGKGVLGEVVDEVLTKKVALGSPELMQEQGVDISEYISIANGFRSDGQTVLFLSVDKVFAGMICVADPIKNSAYLAIESLKKMGISITMLTGDNKITAIAVAKQLGIENVIAEALPDTKLSVIKEQQESNKVVAMVGDGINDAPALAQADVGIAMGTGTDIAIESADVTLVKGDLSRVLQAIKLSRQTMTNIKQNLFFAFFYNGLGVPVAAGILYPIWGILLNPMFAAAAMSLSSVSVIGNALRLKYYDSE